MCRLYVFKSTEETKVECTLVHAQNALMAQSRKDQSGYSHAHGWGMACYDDAQDIHVERQCWAAYHGEHFARAASRIYSSTVVAHVRRATVGEPKLANTHPFCFKNWAFVHNGTVPQFARIRPLLLEKVSPQFRNLIEGETDSEHLFYYLMSLKHSNPQLSVEQMLKQVASDVEQWVDRVAAESSIGLNLVLTDGTAISGTKFGRSLFCIERIGVYDCEICGFPHIHHHRDRDHRAVVVASEPITHEDWEEVPERTLWNIDKNARLSISTL